MDCKRPGSLILHLDLPKAFDSIENALLLSKLCALGVSVAARNWFKSYFTGRSQTVRIEHWTCVKYHTMYH